MTIERGENRGHTLAYTNVVRRWVKLGDWNGKAETFSVPVASLADAEFSVQDIDRVAVIVQSGDAAKPGLMLGAALAESALTPILSFRGALKARTQNP